LLYTRRGWIILQNLHELIVVLVILDV